MINRWIMQPVLLLWFLPTALFISYKQLEITQRNSISACLDLFKQLDGPLCLSDRMDFKIPMEVKHPRQIEKNDAVFIIEEMLRNIFLIFKSNSSSTGWDKIIVESFLDKLHVQMKFLKEILEEISENESLTPRNLTIPPLKSYYKRIRRYLTNKEYSSCAWMIVRAEIHRNFVIIRRLTRIFQN